MSVRVRWMIFVGLCVVGIGLLWLRQARRAALFEQVASNDMQTRVQATRLLLERKIIPGALPAQPVIIRSKISRGLARLRSREAIAVLISLLGDTEDAPGRWARNALVEVGAPAVSALSEVLLGGDENAKKKAVVALARIGPPAVPFLRRLLSDATAQANACLALGEIGAAAKTSPEEAEKAFAPLLRSISSLDTALANAAIPVLGDKKVKAAVEPLRKLLSQDALRKNAIIALGEISDPRATLDLLPFISDPLLRMDAVRALGQIGDGRAAASLAATLTDRDKDYRSALVLALQRIGTPAAGLLVGYLHSPDVYVRRAAAQSLRGEAVPAIVPALRKALSDPDAQVRAAAASALGWRGNTTAIPALLSALHDEEGMVVDAAISALADIGPDAIPSLLDMFSRPDPTFSFYGSRALVEMGEEAFPVLVDALDSPHPKTRLWAAVALGDMGDRQAVPALLRTYEHAQGDLRWVIDRALRKLGASLPVSDKT